MLVRYIQNYEGIDLKENREESTFEDDASISGWAKESVYLCQKAGLVNGMTSTTFAPQNAAARAQVATIMVRTHQQYL